MGATVTPDVVQVDWNVPDHPGSACKRFRLECQESLERSESEFTQTIALSPHARGCVGCMRFAKQLFVLHQEAAISQCTDQPEFPAHLVDTILANLHQQEPPRPIRGIISSILACFALILGCMLVIPRLWPALGSPPWIDQWAELNERASDWILPVREAIGQYIRLPEVLADRLVLWTNQQHENLLLLTLVMFALVAMAEIGRKVWRNRRSTDHGNGAMP